MLLTVTKKKSLMQKSTAQYLCEHDVHLMFTVI